MPSKWWAIIIGVGLALTVVHNKWLAALATNQVGETIFFVPALGYIVLVMGTGMFLLHNWGKVKETGWGDRRITIGLLLIAAAIGLSGLNNEGFQGLIAPLGMGVAFLALYVVARHFALTGMVKWLLVPTLVLVPVAIVWDIAVGIATPGIQYGGLITNYAAAVGFIVMGCLLMDRRWLWLLLGPALVAIFLLGALESIFILGVLGLVLIARRDWGRRMLLPIGVVLIVFVAWFVTADREATFPYTQKNWAAFHAILSGQGVDQYGSWENALEEVSTGRWTVIVGSLKEIRWNGHGYMLTPSPEEGDRRPVHNMPLLAVDQVGLMGGLAWLWVSVYCLVKTKWKYIWVFIFASSVFNYYIWTQFAPFWWVIVAMSTTIALPDHLFKGEITT